MKLNFKQNRRKNRSNRTIGCRDMAKKFIKVHFMKNPSTHDAFNIFALYNTEINVIGNPLKPNR